MAVQKINQGVIICYVGKMGSSKTLSMVREAKLYFDNGYTLYSNFKLKPPLKFTWLDKETIRKMIRGDIELENAVVLLDEAHQIADSRAAASKKNRLFSYLINMSRKKSNRLLLTTQFFGQLDVRLRLATALIVECKKDFVEDKMRVTNKIYTQVAPEDYQLVRVKQFWGNPYFNLYDTDETIYLGDMDVKDTEEEKEAKKAKAREEKEAKRKDKLSEELEKLRNDLDEKFLK